MATTGDLSAAGVPEHVQMEGLRRFYLAVNPEKVNQVCMVYTLTLLPSSMSRPVSRHLHPVPMMFSPYT
jgi:hypothetical protein